MSTPVWSIPAYHTDEDAWRERIEAKRAENHARWAANRVAWKNCGPDRRCERHPGPHPIRHDRKELPQW